MTSKVKAATFRFPYAILDYLSFFSQTSQFAPWILKTSQIHLPPDNWLKQSISTLIIMFPNYCVWLEETLEQSIINTLGHPICSVLTVPPPSSSQDHSLQGQSTKLCFPTSETGMIFFNFVSKFSKVHLGDHKWKWAKVQTFIMFWGILFNCLKFIDYLFNCLEFIHLLC